MLETVLEQHELLHEGAMREQETVLKQKLVQESWQKDAKRVPETVAKQQKSFYQNAQCCSLSRGSLEQHAKRMLETLQEQHEL